MAARLATETASVPIRLFYGAGKSLGAVASRVLRANIFRRSLISFLKVDNRPMTGRSGDAFQSGGGRLGAGDAVDFAQDTGHIPHPICRAKRTSSSGLRSVSGREVQRTVEKIVHNRHRKADAGLRLSLHPRRVLHYCLEMYDAA